VIVCLSVPCRPAKEKPKPKPVKVEAPAAEEEEEEEEEEEKEVSPPASPSAAAAAPAEKKAAPQKRRAPLPAQAPIVAQHTFTVQVGEPEKIAEGSYVVYRITAKTNLKAYKMREMAVSRRFSDFHSLQKNLTAKYQGVIVPPCPPKDVVGTFSVKMGKGDASNSSFIERRQCVPPPPPLTQTHIHTHLIRPRVCAALLHPPVLSLLMAATQ
jgi:hypothetical protein